MIEALQDWAMVLSGVAVFGSLCEVILPEGSFQKYIRLGLGMILVLALLSPVQELLHREWKIEETEQKKAYRETEAMEEKQKEEVLRIYRENLNRKMLSSLQVKMPEFSGRVQCSVEEKEENFGAIRNVLILMDAEEVDGKGVQRILNEEFGVTPEQITLRF